MSIPGGNSCCSDQSAAENLELWRGQIHRKRGNTLKSTNFNISVRLRSFRCQFLCQAFENFQRPMMYCKVFQERSMQSVFQNHVVFCNNNALQAKSDRYVLRTQLVFTRWRSCVWRSEGLTDRQRDHLQNLIFQKNVAMARRKWGPFVSTPIQCLKFKATSREWLVAVRFHVIHETSEPMSKFKPEVMEGRMRKDTGSRCSTSQKI